MLTPHHLMRLRQDLRTLAHIEYEEVENELLDHYATLTEQKMEAGQVFEYASANAWAELGAGPGLNAIQRDYEKNIRKQISTRHLEILEELFPLADGFDNLVDRGSGVYRYTYFSRRCTYSYTPALSIYPNGSCSILLL